MKRYFRIPLLVIGYYLYIQAILGAFAAFSSPENLFLIWLLCFGIAAVGHGLIKTARRWRPVSVVPDTQPLSAVDQASNPTHPIDKR